jgi:hypothetical protein
MQYINIQAVHCCFIDVVIMGAARSFSNGGGAASFHGEQQDTFLTNLHLSCLRIFLLIAQEYSGQECKFLKIQLRMQIPAPPPHPPSIHESSINGIKTLIF